MFVSIARQVRLGAATAAIALATFSQSFGAEGPFAGCSGPHLVEAILLAFQETHQPPSVEQVARVISDR